MKLTKKDIEEARLSPELTAEITGLFDLHEAKETELVKLRAKVPTDSQKIVENVDYEKFTAATQELQKIKDEMQAKLLQSPAPEAKSFLGFLDVFFV